MRIEVNGEAMEIERGLTVAALLADRDPSTGVAVAVNGEFVPRSRFEACELRDGDRVEIVAPMQGG